MNQNVALISEVRALRASRNAFKNKLNEAEDRIAELENLIRNGQGIMAATGSQYPPADRWIAEADALLIPKEK